MTSAKDRRKKRGRRNEAANNPPPLPPLLEKRPNPDPELEEDFPLRPDYGTKGDELELWANYLALFPSTDLRLHHYSVSVSPTAQGKKSPTPQGKKLEQIIRLYLESPEVVMYRSDIVTDFKSTIISRVELNVNNGDGVGVVYRAEHEAEPAPNPTTYTVQLGEFRVFSVADVLQYITTADSNPRSSEKQSVVQALNILMNHGMKGAQNVITLGASKSFSIPDKDEDNDQHKDRRDLGGGLIARRGFYTSVRAATGRMLLNVNLSHSAFYRPLRLDQLINDSGYKGDTERLAPFIRRLRVEVTHFTKKNKSRKTIWGLPTPADGRKLENPPRIRGDLGARDVEFWFKRTDGGGHYVSVYDHFMKAHRIKVRDDMPVINVGNFEHPNYLPAQVCDVLPNQSVKHELGPTHTQGMIKFAVLDPKPGLKHIQDEAKLIGGESRHTFADMKKFDIKVSDELVKVNGRNLPPPAILYKDGTRNAENGGWFAGRCQYKEGALIRKWACIILDMERYPKRDRTVMKLDVKQAGDAMEAFANILEGVGVRFENNLNKKPVIVPWTLSNSGEQDLDDKFKTIPPGQDLLVFVFPKGPIPIYNRLKYLADTRYGFNTICCVARKLTDPKGQYQYLQNNALKVNLKLGGINHIVDNSSSPLIKEKDDKTMIVGIDVTHPGPASSDKAPSVAAMVASVDWRLAQWPGILKLQNKSGEEMVSSLTEMLMSRLKLWSSKHHGKYPENIIVYRDGVSEGQYETVLTTELPQLREACKLLYTPEQTKNNIPRMTIIIVGKRHHTRFYVSKETDGDDKNHGNPKPGLVVDRGITEARNWDFFLQAHAAVKGTARPAHYFVVLDEIFRTQFRGNGKGTGTTTVVSDELQLLTQRLCYSFGRANKAVSYCTPAYYADILCERGRCYLHQQFNPGAGGPPPAAAKKPAGGSSATFSGFPTPSATPRDPLEVHDELKDRMFYI
ncbi:ribonuclease H-like domain-containing protein [Nemania sp. FL0916]|nr:ribonuclease H-like domain-containing protein [Nemania sp. FL0916]